MQAKLFINTAGDIKAQRETTAQSHTEQGSSNPVAPGQASSLCVPTSHPLCVVDLSPQTSDPLVPHGAHSAKLKAASEGGPQDGLLEPFYLMSPC